MKITCHTSDFATCTIVAGAGSFSELTSFLKAYSDEKIFILVDENTQEHCLPMLLSSVPSLAPAQLLIIPPGEESKDITVASQLWTEIINSGAGRGALLVNLGGGVVTDLGGFVASVCKRGISYINIPTTLIGMVDASIGGKTGVNAGMLKNQAGSFYMPEAVFVHFGFLSTLAAEHFLSGLGEMIKYALIADEQMWLQLRKMEKPDLAAAERMIERCISIKAAITEEDFRERDRRALLNFGHSIGHAFESLALGKKEPLAHGRAIAMGMICESYISTKLTGLDSGDHIMIRDMLISWFGLFPVTTEEIIFMKKILEADKKKSPSGIKFALLEKPGRGAFGIPVPDELVMEAFQYYLHLKSS